MGLLKSANHGLEICARISVTMSVGRPARKSRGHGIAGDRNGRFARLPRTIVVTLLLVGLLARRTASKPSAAA
jgi:hypothetical protein